MPPNEVKSLSMVQLKLDAATIIRESQRLGLSTRHEDLGYLIHGTLAGLFGKGVIQPFHVISTRKRWLPVLGYTQRTKEELLEYAQTYTEPGFFSACDWEAFSVKTMPSQWNEGKCLGFQTRVCPVVRLASKTEFRDRSDRVHYFKPGTEVDAWMHRCRLVGDSDSSISRSQVYGQWLNDRLTSAASIQCLQIEAFRRIRLVRRGHQTPRRSHLLERPDVLFKGQLIVKDGCVFQNVLEKGVGRHRAFGFGMLLVRPPEEGC